MVRSEETGVTVKSETRASSLGSKEFISARKLSSLCCAKNYLCLFSNSRRFFIFQCAEDFLRLSGRSVEHAVEHAVNIKSCPSPQTLSDLAAFPLPLSAASMRQESPATRRSDVCTYSTSEIRRSLRGGPPLRTPRINLKDGSLGETAATPHSSHPTRRCSSVWPHQSGRPGYGRRMWMT